MLGTESKKSAIESIKVQINSSFGDFYENRDKPIIVFNGKEYFGIIDSFKGWTLDDKARDMAKRIEPIDGDEPLCVVAKKLLEHKIRFVPIAQSWKAVTVESLLSALKSTTHLAKREARVVMGPIQPILEKRVHNIQNVSSRGGHDALPIVNDAGRLIALWHKGKLVKKPETSKEKTRLKILIPKILKQPVVVIDRHRKPIGILQKRDLLKLSTDYVETEIPIFYSGLDDVAIEKQAVKDRLDSMIKKVSKIVSVNYVSFHIKQRKAFQIKLKLSTRWGSYIIDREGRNPLQLVDELADYIEQEVVENKEKRTKFRELSE
ncbi:MAG: hypothetical protein GOU99_00125 [Candidatus Altiarchaeota archaeon]|nr:hypothetical protein [Candidatus Altiarchaeota archaeon]